MRGKLCTFHTFITWEVAKFSVDFVFVWLKNRKNNNNVRVETKREKTRRHPISKQEENYFGNNFLIRKFVYFILFYTSFCTGPVAASCLATASACCRCHCPVPSAHFHLPPVACFVQLSYCHSIHRSVSWSRSETVFNFFIQKKEDR